MDVNQLMQMANQLKQQLQGAQSEAQNSRYVGEAGAGLVRVVMNGQHDLVEVQIDPKALSDKTFLEDLMRAAVNQASLRVREDLKQRMGGMAKGLGIDMGALGL